MKNIILIIAAFLLFASAVFGQGSILFAGVSYRTFISVHLQLPEAVETNIETRQGHVTGHVKWFNQNKGFGSLTRDDGAIDVYCNVSGFKGIDPHDIVEGLKVQYDVVQTNKGGRAINITLIEEE